MQNYKEFICKSRSYVEAVRLFKEIPNHFKGRDIASLMFRRKHYYRYVILDAMEGRQTRMAKKIREYFSND